MKKKWTASILAFLLALSLLAGCGAETTSQPDISAKPARVLRLILLTPSKK